MLSKEKLGQAIAAAIELKKASGAIRKEAEVARHFGIKQPSLAAWKNRGTIGKDKLPELWRFFSDVVGPEHWGMSAWPMSSEASESDSVVTMPRTDIARFDVLDIVASCGPGVVNTDYPEIVHAIEMPVEMARRMIGRTDSAVKVIRASKDSMHPTINPNDLLFVDTSVIEFKGEGVYLIQHGGDLLCKRMSRVGKTLMVTSDNAHYPPWAWDERMHDTRIVGSVLRALPMDFKNFGG